MCIHITGKYGLCYVGDVFYAVRYVWVNVMLCPPPNFTSLSVRTGVQFVIFGVLDVVVSLVSCIVIMSGCVVCASCLSSSCLFLCRRWYVFDVFLMICLLLVMF